MPPRRQSPSHSRILSPYSHPPLRNAENLGPPIDVYRFDKLIDSPEEYERIQIALFGRYDLSVKTMMYKHIHETTERLRDGVHRQSVRAVQLFDEMVNTGLHQQLGDIGREPLIIIKQEEIKGSKSRRNRYSSSLPTNPFSRCPSHCHHPTTTDTISRRVFLSFTHNSA